MKIIAFLAVVLLAAPALAALPKPDPSAQLAQAQADVDKAQTTIRLQVVIIGDLQKERDDLLAQKAQLQIEAEDQINQAKAEAAKPASKK